MPTKAEYEHGARKLEPRTGKDPSDDFSQDAARNRKPKDGAGLSKKPAKAPRDTRDRPAANPR
ncbi:MAG: hypothetical protein AB7S80_17255 [Rhizobiaceae bacterium]